MVPPAHRDAAAAHAAEMLGGLPLGVLAGTHIHTVGDLVLRVQYRLRESLETYLDFDQQARVANTPVPAVHASGVAPNGVWWVAVDRVPLGAPGSRPLRAFDLGRHIARFQRDAPVFAPSTSVIGASWLWLCWLDELDPRGFDELAGRFDSLTALSGELVACHGDVSVPNNVCFDGDDVIALIDPGEFRSAPAAFDLAHAVAIEMLSGHPAEPLLSGYLSVRSLPERFEDWLELMVCRMDVHARLTGRVFAA